MKVDYIIVGLGLAGISFCEELKANNKTFVVFDDASQKSSTIAGGMYNPVILKRFTSVWKSKEQLQLALPMYQRLEKELNVTLDYKIPVYRKFASLEEQNNWFTASDNSQLSEYLSTKIIKNSSLSIDAPFGFGEVLNIGRIDVKTLIEAYKTWLLKDKLLLQETFNYGELKSSEIIKYNNVEANYIVFCEGFGVTQNPFFKNLPLVPTKGELLIIKSPELKIDFILKSGVFLIPLQNDNYIVGATYEWDDLTQKVTEEAKAELLSKLNKVINCKYTIVKHVAGIRPTVKDRRPLVGKHPNYENMYVLNGLGTRGVMIGPYVAKQLYNFIENGIFLEKEIDIKRFE